MLAYLKTTVLVISCKECTRNSQHTEDTDQRENMVVLWFSETHFFVIVL